MSIDAVAEDDVDIYGFHEWTNTPVEGMAFLVAKVIQAILPIAVFCWISRTTVQLQAMIWSARWPYWSQITDQIYLGAVPLDNWGHIDAISRLGVGAILSFNEDHELQQQIGAKPIQEKEWTDRNIHYLRLSSPDLSPVSVADLAKAVDYIRSEVLLGHKVYVHCTAGRGRSASAVICYLIKEFRWSLTQALSFVKQQRLQTILSTEQLISIYNWQRPFLT
jgi:atypical dual specificity phosphatase